MITSQDILKQLREAIKSHGKNSFWDRGPREVMDIQKIISRLVEMNPDQVLELLRSLVGSNDKGRYVAETLAIDLADHDELFDGLCKLDPKFITELYG